jgi:hypothetical protein
VDVCVLVPVVFEKADVDIVGFSGTLEGDPVTDIVGVAITVSLDITFFQPESA